MSAPDSFVVRPPGDSLDRTVEALHRYAETFLSSLSGARRVSRVAGLQALT